MKASKEELEDLFYSYEERAAIMEYDGGLTRADAEREAAKCHGFGCSTALLIYTGVINK
jgi:hypothetical protein